MGKTQGKFVAYYRVSTARQGRSGLGLEAQRRAVEDYLNGGNWKVLREFTEIESGKRNDRPELAKALHLCRVTGATLVIAKLDRLSRNAAFLLNLRDAGAKFCAADMPEADETMVGVMALIAQRERKMISQRTKEALAAAKRRGVRLGNPNGARALLRARKGNVAAVAAASAKADAHATALKPIIEGLMAEGITSFGKIAQALNKQGMQTPRGGRWYKSSARNLVMRLTAAERRE